MRCQRAADVMSATVTVVAPYQVCHNGQVHGPGATVEVPDAIAEEWTRLGWVQPAPARKAPAKKAAARSQPK